MLDLLNRMRTSRRIFSCLALGTILCAGSAFGARFELVGSDPTPIPITGSNFFFDANVLGGGVFEFQNATGGTLTSLTFRADIPNPGCSPAPAFALSGISVTGLSNTGFSYAITTSCPSSGFDHFVLTILGTELHDQTGVFTIDLNDDPNSDDPGGAGGWDGAKFQNSVTSTVPEPATYGLIGAGLAGLAIFRRRRSA